MPQRLTATACGNTVILMTTLSFKVSDEEAGTIRRQARQEGVSVSEFLRRRARTSMPPSQTPARVRCPHTGALVFAAPAHLAPLTTDTVRELLADFP